MQGELWQVVIMRRVLNEFCVRNELSVRDRPALEAASLLMKLVNEGIDSDDELREKLNAAMYQQPAGDDFSTEISTHRLSHTRNH